MVRKNWLLVILPVLVIFLTSAVAFAQDMKFSVGAASGDWTGERIGFYAFASLALAAGLAMLLSKNPVHAALFLVVSLFSMAGIYVLLHATFMAAIQVLVYAGAIMVLFVFVVMSVGHPEYEDLGILQSFFTKLVGIGAAGLLIGALVSPFFMEMRHVPGRTIDELPKSFGSVLDVGHLLFSKYLLPFEAISLLLLIAIVGAVMVSHGHGERGK